MSEASYWAVLTAPILESTEVSDGAKLFYAQVSRLTNVKGYCWASNRELSEVLHVTKRSVTRYVAELERAGFIASEFVGVKDRKRREGGDFVSTFLTCVGAAACTAGIMRLVVWFDTLRRKI